MISFFIKRKAAELAKANNKEMEATDTSKEKSKWKRRRLPFRKIHNIVNKCGTNLEYKGMLKETKTISTLEKVVLTVTHIHNFHKTSLRAKFLKSKVF